MTNIKTNEKETTIDKQNYSKKKSLKEVLSSYLDKKQKNGKSIIKIKKDLAKLNLNFTKEKTSVETLIELQKKLNLAYNNISNKKNGEKNSKKDN